MKDLIRKVDVFGGEPCLYIHKHKHFQTFSGGITSLVAGLIMLGLSITLSMDLIRKTKPSVRTVSSSTSNTSLSLNRSDFFFSFVTVDSKGRPFKYDPNFSLVQSYMEQTGSRKNNSSDNEAHNITFIDCQEEFIKDFESVSSDVIEVLTLYGKCLQFDNNEFFSSPKISPSVSHFKFEVLHNIENIKQLNTAAFPYKFYFFYQNVVFDTLNYNQPTRKALGFQKYEIPEDTMIIVSAEISILYIDTIKDLLLTEGHELKTGYGVGSVSAVKNMVQEYDNGFQKHLEITLSLSDQTIKYIREYPTILDVFSKIGGMIQIILMIVHIVLNVSSESEILWYLYLNYFLSHKRKSVKFNQTLNDISINCNNIMNNNITTNTNTNNNNNIQSTGNTGNGTNYLRKLMHTNNKGLSKVNTTQILSQSNLNSMKHPECKASAKLHHSDSLLKYETNLKKEMDNSKVMMNPYLRECSITKELVNNYQKKGTLIKSNLSSLKSSVHKKREDSIQLQNNQHAFTFKNACCYHYCFRKGKYTQHKLFDPFDYVKNALDINKYFLLSDEFNIMKYIILNKDNKELFDNIEKCYSPQKQEKIIEKAKRCLIRNYSMQSFQS